MTMSRAPVASDAMQIPDQTPDQTPVERTVERVAGFVRVLRHNGFTVGLREQTDAMVIANQWDFKDLAGLRDAWRSLLCANAKEWKKYSNLFDGYWLRRGVKQMARVSPHTGTSKQRKTMQDLGENGGQWKVDRIETASGGEGDGKGGDSKSEGASRGESLLTTDLRHMHDPEQLRKAHALAAQLASKLRARLTRRAQSVARGRRLDLRKVIRSSIPYGGTPLRLAFKKPKPKPLRLVLLMDVSGSMDQYSAFFLRFMAGVLHHVKGSDAFAFHTRLIHISQAMRETNPRKAIERLNLMTTGWSGGTRIGESLESFNRHHAKWCVNGRTVVMILSDGYDTCEPEMVGEQLALLQKRAKRIVWLNPMMGWDGYTPTAQAMAGALDHIDLLAPAHNLQSLADLEPYLANL